ncbi:MAG TPA: cell division protein FtsQ/DivIB [Geminicoccaceae bacterium]|nr:cell division protein FtsQ/DivIB [Geminicoccaceae bacterium]
MRRLNRALRRRPRPRWFWPAVTAAVLALPVAALGYGLGSAYRSGALAALAEGATGHALRLSAEAGLRVKTVYAEGLLRTARDELAAEAAIELGQPILALDLARVKERVERLTWVGSATVTRSLPDTVAVRLVERSPLALWRRGDGGFELVDRRGEVIRGGDATAFGGLPVLVGDEAPSRAAELFATASSAPDLLGRIRAAVLVGGRRWDVELDNGVAVRLPEEDIETAWRLLATRLRDARLLEPPTSIVDLRLPDRLVLRRRLDEGERPGDGGRTAFGSGGRSA